MNTYIFNVGDQVRHNQSNEIATITAVRKVVWYQYEGEINAYTLDFGHSVKGAFDLELNGEEFRAEALTLVEPRASSWMTDYTAEDFRKLQPKYEIHELDTDVMGQRFRLTTANSLGELQVFVSDYAGNEAHALYYIWDEFAGEVKANVRPLDYLRSMLTEARGWQRIS